MKRSTIGIWTVLAVARLATSAAIGVDQARNANATDEDDSVRAIQGRASGTEFQLFSQYSAAAYCEKLYDGFDNTPVCANMDDEACPNYRNTTTVSEFLNGFYDVGGYIAVNPERRHIVVAFKGTDSLYDALTDMTALLVPSDLCTGCYAHKGFHIASVSIRDKLLPKLRDMMKKPERKDFRLVVTGHSLGGAVAALVAAHLRNQHLVADLYTYGAPRVGNEQLARHISSQRGGGFTARITNGRDLVTAIPSINVNPVPGLNGGVYAHHFPEYWYSDGLRDGRRPYGVARRKCRDDGECSSAHCYKPLSWLFRGGCSIADHTRYFNGFQPCASPAASVSGRLSNSAGIMESQGGMLLLPDFETWATRMEDASGGRPVKKLAAGAMRRIARRKRQAVKTWARWKKGLSKAVRVLGHFVVGGWRRRKWW